MRGAARGPAAPDTAGAWHQTRPRGTRPAPGTGRVRLALLTVAGVAAALLAAGCGGDDAESPAVPLGRYIAATRNLNPSTHFFGDTVRARVDVVVDRDHLDPSRVRLTAKFTPYEQIGATVVERRDYDRYTRLRYDLNLRCLARACLTGEISPGITPAGEEPEPRRAERVFRFGAAHLYYDDPRTRRPRHLRRVWWPRLEAITRISPSDPGLTFALSTPFKTTLTPLPSVTYRISPTLLGSGLLLAAALLLALPSWMTWSWWRGRRRPPPVEEVRELTPLERALLLVEQARDSVDGEDRRKALEVLASELDTSEGAAHAAEARRLAWSSATPSPEAAEALVRSVKEQDAR